MSKIDESEILIHTDQTAIFLNGQHDPNRWSRKDERLFLQEFLEYYNTNVLSTGEEFHYETFYDYYSGYLTNRENADSIEGFWSQFNERHLKGQEYIRDCHNRIADFNRSYNQLIASQLHKSTYFNDVSYSDYPPYDFLIRFLKNQVLKYDIKIHSLNHDLFLDWLGNHHADLWQHFDDGYRLEGSPYYGTASVYFNQGTTNEVHRSYKVKLEYFADKYDKPICLYKLHGSISNVRIYIQKPEPKWVRIKNNYAVSYYQLEEYDSHEKEYVFTNLHDEASPDFLSGTTNKTRYYTGDPYYANLFKHFEKNLSSSEILIVIGYGFKDSGINEYLAKYFLSKERRMYVVSPTKPDCELLDRYGATFIGKSVSELADEDYAKFVHSESS
jgi:hypothetical protein